MKTYSELREVIIRYRHGSLTRSELISAFGLWQISGAPL